MITMTVIVTKTKLVMKGEQRKQEFVLFIKPLIFYFLISVFVILIAQAH